MKALNNISTKQNEEKMLNYQFGARICYEKTDKFYYLSFVFIALLIIMDTLALYRIVEKNYLLYFSIFVNVMIMYIRYKRKSYNSKAAYYKSQFDGSLYNQILEKETKNIKNEEFLLELIAKNKTRYYYEVNNNGVNDYNGVKDWYFDIDNGESLINSIFTCQKQNVYFSEKTSKFNIIKLNFSIALIIFFGGVVFTKYPELWLELFLSLLAIGCEVAKLLINQYRYYDIMSNLNYLIYDINDPTNIHLSKIQKSIEESRKIERLSGKKFYKKHSLKIHNYFNKLLNNN